MADCPEEIRDKDIFSEDIETKIKACYTTWGENYYDKYYGPNAAYPPVHRDLLRTLLLEARAKRVLDAGCGPASFLRELANLDMEVFGFDLTSEMVQEARKVLAVASSRAYLGRKRPFTRVFSDPWRNDGI
ncbi:MAG: class I SAM-dependent methyltransferase [Thermodesulfobacteriota bacterium]